MYVGKYRVRSESVEMGTYYSNNVKEEAEDSTDKMVCGRDETQLEQGTTLLDWFLLRGSLRPAAAARGQEAAQSS